MRVFGSCTYVATYITLINVMYKKSQQVKEVSHAAIWLKNVELTRLLALIILTAVLKNSDAGLVSIDSLESSITLNGT